MAEAALNAVKDESMVNMFVAIVKAAQNWNTISDIEIMHVKARLETIRQKLCPNTVGPLEIMQCNVQPYPFSYICSAYLPDIECNVFTCDKPPVIEINIVDEDIIGIFKEIPISFMLQNRHNVEEVRFMKLFQEAGNLEVILDRERWVDNQMDYDTEDEEVDILFEPIEGPDDYRNRRPLDNDQF